MDDVCLREDACNLGYTELSQQSRRCSLVHPAFAGKVVFVLVVFSCPARARNVQHPG